VGEEEEEEGDDGDDEEEHGDGLQAASVMSSWSCNLPAPRRG
jgi:hypothetical protein